MNRTATNDRTATAGPHHRQRNPRSARANGRPLPRTRADPAPRDTAEGGPTEQTGGCLLPHEYSASVLARRFASQLLEVLLGHRPLRQLRDRLDKPVAGLLTTLVRSGRAVASDTRLRSVHACPTNSATVEACAIITDSKRTRAATLRLERFHTDWACTMFRLV